LGIIYTLRYDHYAVGGRLHAVHQFSVAAKAPRNTVWESLVCIIFDRSKSCRRELMIGWRICRKIVGY